MNIELLNKTDKFLLEVDDIAKLLSVTKASAIVEASRYSKRGSLIRLKRGLFIAPSRFKSLSEDKLFQIANLLQTPSYVSLTTALSYYEITTQQQQNFIESIALKRTKEFVISNIVFTFALVKKEFYFGFEPKGNFFIATPEKALADAVYLSALGKYNCDFAAVDFKKVNIKTVEAYLEKTNKRTKEFWGKLCKSYKI